MGLITLVLSYSPEGFFRLNKMSLFSYIKETKSELRHVNWPTRHQAVVFTVLVILLAIATGIYLGLFDFLFNILLREVIL